MVRTPYETIQVEREGPLAILRLNRPDKLNAFSAQMRAEQWEALLALNADASVRVIIHTGNGRAYSAGADLTHSGPAAPESESRGDRSSGDWIRFCQQAKPIIAAVNGVAVGMGVSQMMWFDVRIAAAEARFGFRFARAGMVPEIGTTGMLPRLIGFGNAMDVCLRARFVAAEEALRMGFVTEVVPGGQLLDRARAIAEEMLEVPPQSLAESKRLFWEHVHATDFGDVAHYEERVLAEVQSLPEALEAVRSLMEKRRPSYFPAAAPPVRGRDR